MSIHADKLDAAGSQETILSVLQDDVSASAIHALETLTMQRVTDHGTILFGREADSEWTVVVKTFSGRGAFKWAEGCFQNHQAVFAALDPSGPYRVPEPLTAFSAIPGYAMRYVDGTPAKELLKSRKLFKTNQRSQTVRKAAAWLSAFHGCLGAQTSKVSVPFLTRDVLTRHGQALDSNQSIPRLGAFESVLDFLIVAGEDLGGFEFPKGLRHGDFGAQNLLIEGDIVWGMDFGSGGPSEIRPVSIDAANFLIQTEAHLALRSATRAGSPGGISKDLITAFRGGYPNLPWESAELAWLFLLHQLEHWVRIDTASRDADERAARAEEMCEHGAATLEARLP